MHLPVASWPSHTGLFNAEAFYSVEIWAASVKRKHRTRASVSFRWEDMNTSTLRAVMILHYYIIYRASSNVGTFSSQDKTRFVVLTLQGSLIWKSPSAFLCLLRSWYEIIAGSFPTFSCILSNARITLLIGIIPWVNTCESLTSDLAA